MNPGIPSQRWPQTPLHTARRLLWGLITVLVLALTTATPVPAQEDLAQGRGASASARLRFKIVIPQQVAIRVVNASTGDESGLPRVSAQANDVFAIRVRLSDNRIEHGSDIARPATPLPDLLACRRSRPQQAADCLLALP
jgi:hypothetical protein